MPGSEEAVHASVVSSQLTSIQNYLATVKVMSTGVGRQRGHKHLCMMAIPGFDEDIFVQEYCGYKPPQGGHWAHEFRKVTKQMWQSNEVMLH
jgi:hypothetical protein